MTAQGKKSRETGKFRAIGVGLAASLFVSALMVTGHDAAFAQEPEARAAPSKFEHRSRFTPARGDKRLAVALAKNKRPDRVISFTPAGADPEADKLRVAVRADSNSQSRRPAASPEVRDVAGTPVAQRLTNNSYNLGVAVGWKRFAVAGDVSETRSRIPAIEDRERAAVGLSYNRDSFSAGAKVSGERSASPAPALASRETYSLDVGGKINISKHIAVTGGVRYRIDQERVDPALEDNRRDSQAVYVGTNFRF